MQKNIIKTMISIACACIFPGILFSLVPKRSTIVEFSPETLSVIESTGILLSYDITILYSDGTTAQIPLEDYIVGVVLKEMPSTFATEALKAQAVAARTYALKHCLDNPKHSNADICSDPACCQAYWAVDSYMDDGGDPLYVKRVREAVSATSGEVLCYGGKLIEATYFSTSGGMTEAAVAVWGEDVPYLQSIVSPGEEYATHYTDTVYIDINTFQKNLNITLHGSPNDWIRNITYTDGGGIANITICGTTFTGIEIRSLLGLRSTAIQLTPAGNGITITTKGFGHRVGMSQYGADYMAKNKSDYKEILLYYYQNVEITDMYQFINT